MSEENKTIARRYALDVWSQPDPSLIDELMTPDVTYRVVPFITQGLRGTEAVKRLFQFLRKVFPDSAQSVDEVIAEADRVMVRVSARGTYSGEWRPGLIPTGKRVVWSGIEVYHISGGKIVDVTVVEDGLGLLHQRGDLQTWNPAGPFVLEP